VIRKLARQVRRAIRVLIGDQRYIQNLESALNVTRRAIADMALVKHPIEADGYYELSGVRFYRSSFNVAWFEDFGITPRAIVDVGSYDAGDAVRFKLAFPQARVIAFEADPERAVIVSERAARFGVEAVCSAAFSHEGAIEWYQATVDGRIGSQGSAYRQTDALNQKFPHVRQHARAITVPATRLETYCMASAIDHIDLLHIDAQGAEHDVLTGLGPLRPSLVYLELDDGVAGWIGAKGRDSVHALMTGMDYVVAADCITDRLYVRREGVCSGR
jgi:FkbM family methyltransferase